MVLNGIKVLDLTRLLPGPFCTMFLADHGAEVIKIEEPGKSDAIRMDPPYYKGIGYGHLVVNRGKKCITLNLKSNKGREIFLRLVRQSDVVVEGFRPGVMDRLGLSYESLKKENPRLIYCSISGFGQYGPYRNTVGHDINYISYAGILGNTGTEGGPPVIPGTQIADLGGGLLALAGILMALIGRQKDQCGKMVDISMTDAAFILGISSAYTYAACKNNPLRGGEKLTGGLACYHVYKTKDARFISIGALEPKFWASLCRALNLEELIADHYALPERQKEMIVILETVFATRNLDDWIMELKEVDTCFSPVLTMEEVFKDPHFHSREMILGSDCPGEYMQLGQPIKIKGVSGKDFSSAPESGEQNEEILISIGYSPEEISKLRYDGVI